MDMTSFLRMHHCMCKQNTQTVWFAPNFLPSMWTEGVHKCLASFCKHPCPHLHSSLLVQQECSSLVSDQWHSVAGHKILLFRCHCRLTSGHTLVLLWCWKGLPSDGWWWACWRLGDIPWQCSQCPCEQEIQRHVRVYSLFHYLISQSPRMFHLYPFISCTSSWSFPASLSVLVFHVPLVMLSLPWIFAASPVAHLTPLSWYTVEGVVLVDLGGDWSGMVWLLIFIT